MSDALQTGWLGEDAKQWTQSVRNGYSRAFILHALFRTGAIQTLRETPGLTSQQLADRVGLDAHLLDGVLNFLAFADRVLVKDGDRFSLTPEGEAWMFADPFQAFIYGAMGSYSCLMTELLPALRGEREYGKDFVRDGEMLAIGSHYTGRHVQPWIIEKMRSLKIRAIADLGCGAADVLMTLCKLDPEIRGVGVDIDPGAIEEAGRRIAAAGLTDRASLVRGDILDPGSWAAEVPPEVGVFNALMVFHEFLRDGEEPLVRAFRGFREAFPGRTMFLGEFDRLSDDELRAMPYPDRLPMLFYQYVIHPLSKQGLPMEKARWLALFARAGVEVVEVKEGLGFRLNIYVLRF